LPIAEKDKTVLVINQNNTERRLFAHLLRAQGLTVVDCADFSDEFERATPETPDLIMMDQAARRGLDLIENAYGESVLKIALVEHDDEAGFEPETSVDPMPVINKPISVSWFVATVDHVLG
jgi:CheY-like chemotaxis protein